jgi:hypothetical protein
MRAPVVGLAECDGGWTPSSSYRVLSVRSPPLTQAASFTFFCTSSSISSHLQTLGLGSALACSSSSLLRSVPGFVVVSCAVLLHAVSGCCFSVNSPNFGERFLRWWPTASHRCCFVAHACFLLRVVIVGVHRELHQFILHRLGSSHTLFLSSPCYIVLMLLPCITHWWRILCRSLPSYAMASSKLQTTMRKFLFDGPWSADNYDGLGFLFVGFTGAPHVEAAATLPATPDLPAHAGSSAASALPCSEYVLLNTISTPTKQSVLVEPDLQVLDLVIALPSHELTRKRKKGYELKVRHFQDSQAAKLPWAEVVMGADGRVLQVRCKVCSFVER